MGIDRFFVQDVTVLRAADVEDRYHNLEPDWPNATETALKGWLSQQSAIEVRDNRDALVTGDILFVAAGADILATDRVRIGTVTYDVDGQPRLAYTPRGPHHIEVTLTAVEG